MWEGTFDILNEQFSLQDATIGLTEFALKKHTMYLKEFLVSAEIFFMVGHRVNDYIFTDKPHCVPQISFQNGREMVIFQIPSFDFWQDNSML